MGKENERASPPPGEVSQGSSRLLHKISSKISSIRHHASAASNGSGRRKFFSIPKEQPRILLNRFSLTFEYRGEQLHGSCCGLGLGRLLLDPFFSPLEVEYIRWYQDQMLTTVRRASLFALLFSVLFLIGAESKNALEAEKGKREFAITSIAMVLVCLAFCAHLYRNPRDHFQRRYNLLTPTTVWVLALSHYHLFRCLLYPSSITTVI